MKIVCIFLLIILFGFFFMMLGSNLFVLFGYDVETGSILAGLAYVAGVQGVSAYIKWKK